MVFSTKRTHARAPNATTQRLWTCTVTSRTPHTDSNRNLILLHVVSLANRSMGHVHKKWSHQLAFYRGENMPSNHNAIEDVEFKMRRVEFGMLSSDAPKNTRFLVSWSCTHPITPCNCEILWRFLEAMAQIRAGSFRLVNSAVVVGLKTTCS